MIAEADSLVSGQDILRPVNYTCYFSSSLLALFVEIDPQFAKLEEMPQSYIETVKRTHEQGGYGSQG